MIRYAWFLVLASLVPACSNGVVAPGFNEEADVKLLFVGNSLTYVHNVPGLVGQLAERHGLSVATATIAYPNFSLEDHWYSGVADDIRRLRPDVVVMQQGPSSLPQNREHLAHWSERLSEVIREAGGEPALYMVWPDVTRRFAFPDVEAAYAGAAQAVNGRLLPAGTTWLRAWDQQAELPLYDADGLHASYLGALAAAQTIFAGLFDIDAGTLPSLSDNVPAAHLDLLRAAVAASLQQWQTSELTATRRLPSGPE